MSNVLTKVRREIRERCERRSKRIWDTLERENLYANALGITLDEALTRIEYQRHIMKPNPRKRRTP